MARIKFATAAVAAAALISETTAFSSSATERYASALTASSATQNDDTMQQQAIEDHEEHPSTTTSAPSTPLSVPPTSNFFENDFGAQPPLGFFDPLGILEGANASKFNRLRYVEIKHGRISMLAVVGYLVTQAGIRLPGDISGIPYDAIPGGFSALDILPNGHIGTVVFLIGLLDTCIMVDVTGGDFVGDFRNGYIDFGWDSFDEATKLKKRAIELNNGRAAQMGILALMVHDGMGAPLIPETF
eukprot:CAMPEP_0172451272 /NCGR_PEP_ID=MMETSP1065-20121228/9376_1 /TAXON_ID=265537 /ORGANISM="Amphiprora paludosa, Strain CCMP125" /LENGTH=243 /DNA_ID=CAMNT_0013203207 /DNA_START=103 /DNA_END=834 /DNA_ORIENTATION=+